jgi:hypothetical protein
VRENNIFLDELTRARLGVEVGRKYDFDIVPASWWGQLKFGWDTSDPAARIAFRLGLVSAGLAILFFFVSEPVAALWRPLLEQRRPDRMRFTPIGRARWIFEEG